MRLDNSKSEFFNRKLPKVASHHVLPLWAQLCFHILCTLPAACMILPIEDHRAPESRWMWYCMMWGMMMESLSAETSDDIFLWIFLDFLNVIHSNLVNVYGSCFPGTQPTVLGQMVPWSWWNKKPVRVCDTMDCGINCFGAFSAYEQNFSKFILHF